VAPALVLDSAARDYSTMPADAAMHDEPETAIPAPGVPDNTPTSGVVSEDQVKLALRRVKDPDLQLNIVDLGLVYGIAVDGTTVKVDMTLTSPACPSGPELMTNAEREVKDLPGVEKVEVNLVWMPFWTPEKMEPRVRAYLGF
jgi:metal-sulfur cluster biosynthetic enzyme